MKNAESDAFGHRTTNIKIILINMLNSLHF